MVNANISKNLLPCLYQCFSMLLNGKQTSIWTSYMELNEGQNQRAACGSCMYKAYNHQTLTDGKNWKSIAHSFTAKWTSSGIFVNIRKTRTERTLGLAHQSAELVTQHSKNYAHVQTVTLPRLRSHQSHAHLPPLPPPELRACCRVHSHTLWSEALCLGSRAERPPPLPPLLLSLERSLSSRWTQQRPTEVDQFSQGSGGSSCGPKAFRLLEGGGCRNTADCFRRCISQYLTLLHHRLFVLKKKKKKRRKYIWLFRVIVTLFLKIHIALEPVC